MTQVTKVIGIGNPDRGDDAAGRIVADRVADRAGGWPAAVDRTIRVGWSAGDPASLLDAWRSTDHVVLVDAVVTGAPPGSVRVVDLLTHPTLLGSRAASSHGLGPVDAVALGRALGALPASLVLIGIEAESFEPGAPLTPAVARGVELATRLIEDRCRGAV